MHTYTYTNICIAYTYLIKARRMCKGGGQNAGGNVKGGMPCMGKGMMPPMGPGAAGQLSTAV